MAYGLPLCGVYPHVLFTGQKHREKFSLDPEHLKKTPGFNTISWKKNFTTWLNMEFRLGTTTRAKPPNPGHQNKSAAPPPPRHTPRWARPCRPPPPPLWGGPPRLSRKPPSARPEQPRWPACGGGAGVSLRAEAAWLTKNEQKGGGRHMGGHSKNWSVDFFGKPVNHPPGVGHSRIPVKNDHKCEKK